MKVHGAAAAARSWLKSHDTEGLVVILGLAFAVMIGCGEGGGQPTETENRAPMIASGPTADPASIEDTFTASITVTATDADGDALTYAWTAEGGTIDGSGTTVTYTPERVTEEVARRVDVTVSDGQGGSASGFVNVTVTPTEPVSVNNGELTEWTATLTKTNPAGGNAVYSPLAVVFQQDATNPNELAGTNRDNNQEVDLVTTGTIDVADIELEVVATNGGSPRATIVFVGTITGPSSNQTISGTYTATGPSTDGGNESGTFSMTHN